MTELVKRNDLQPRPEQVRKLIEEHAESFEQPDQLVRWYYGDPARLAEVEALVMEDNVVEWALGKMKVDDEPTDFDELMGTKKGELSMFIKHAAGRGDAKSRTAWGSSRW